MKRSLGQFPLLNRQTGEEEWATLFRPMDESNVNDFEQKWQPQMRARLQGMKTNAEVEAANIQDIYWRWREKQRARANRLD